jgi:hypothetical protein
MINRIRTQLSRLREQAKLRHALRQAPPTVRTDLWAAADRHSGQRPAIGVDGMSHYPLVRQMN